MNNNENTGVNQFGKAALSKDIDHGALFLEKLESKIDDLFLNIVNDPKIKSACSFNPESLSHWDSSVQGVIVRVSRETEVEFEDGEFVPETSRDYVELLLHVTCPSGEIEIKEAPGQEYLEGPCGTESEALQKIGQYILYTEQMSPVLEKAIKQQQQNIKIYDLPKLETADNRPTDLS